MSQNASEPKPTKRVIVESPYASKTQEGIVRNEAYARAAMLDSLRRGEAPFLSHLLYTQVLDDSLIRERSQGLQAGMAWMEAASLVAVYQDLGVSPGMLYGIEFAKALGIQVDYRSLGPQVA